MASSSERAEWSREGLNWRCPGCAKSFIRPGMSHSCRVVPLDHHFESRPRAAQLFDALIQTIEDVGGPFRLSIAQTRIGLINGVTFAAIMPRRDHLRFHILLQRRLESERVIRIDHYPPWYVHIFRLRDEAELDDEMRGWLREAWNLGLR